MKEPLSPELDLPESGLALALPKKPALGPPGGVRPDVPAPEDCPNVLCGLEGILAGLAGASTLPKKPALGPPGGVCAPEEFENREKVPCCCWDGVLDGLEGGLPKKPGEEGLPDDDD